MDNFKKITILEIIQMVYNHQSFKNRFILYRINYFEESYPINFFIFEILFQNSILPTNPPISKDQNQKVTYLKKIIM